MTLNIDLELLIVININLIEGILKVLNCIEYKYKLQDYLIVIIGNVLYIIRLGLI